MTRWLCPALLVLVILGSYGRLTTMQGVVITDDRFVSDLMNAEFPWRALAGRMIRSGELPLWTSDMCGGYPLLAGGGGTEPVALALHTVLPPRVALNLLMLFILGAAGLGTYAYARSIGASRTGALLSGLVFAYSGFMVCQLKHLGAATCVCWFPLALYFLEKSLSNTPRRAARIQLDAPPAAQSSASAPPVAFVPRLRLFGGFALVFALQVLTGFPQSAYIAGLVYGAYTVLRLPALVWNRIPLRVLASICAGLGVACVLAVGLSAIQLLPQIEFSAISDRGARLDVGDAAHVAFWPRNIWMFVSPYIHGDISNLTYKAPSIFWEDYGYVGLAPLALAVYLFYAAAVRGFRRSQVLIWIVIGTLAMLMVVSTATPFFALAHKHLPGIDRFRFPTRFMFVVDFALAVLGGLGLTRLQLVLSKWQPRLKLRAGIVVWPIIGLATFDLLLHQLRQNPITDAGRWFRPPSTVEQLRRLGAGRDRVFSSDPNWSHIQAFKHARGWSELEPFVRQREWLQVNSNLSWGFGSPDCYSAMVLRWTRELWGPDGVVRRTSLLRPGDGGRASMFHLIGLWNVRYLIAPQAVDVPELRRVGGGEETAIYDLGPHTMPRAFITAGAWVVSHSEEANLRLVDPAFDLHRRVLLGRMVPGAVPASMGLGPTPIPAAASRPGSTNRADIVSYRANEVVIRTSHPTGGYLVLGDSWYPGWMAELDGGAPLPVWRANIGQRAVPLPAGEHTVRFVFKSRTIRQGGLISLGSLLVLGFASGLLPWWWQRKRRGEDRERWPR